MSELPGRRSAAPALAALLLAAAPVLSARAPDGSASPLGAAPAALAAQEWREFRSARRAEGIRSLELEVFYGAGELTIGPAEGPYLYDARVRFDASRFLPARSWATEDGHARLRLAVTPRRERSRGGIGDVRLDGFDLDFDLDDLERLGEPGGRLEVSLGREVPAELRVAVGAAESRLRLGGVPLARLEIRTGASATRLSFDEPNPIRMERLRLQVGAADFRAESLGNARFERFSFEGGVGDVTLDFGGAWRGRARGEVKMGVGELTIRVPADLGVRIRRKAFLASFEAPGLTRTGEAFQSSNWGEADARLELEIEAALGSIEVEVVP